MTMILSLDSIAAAYRRGTVVISDVSMEIEHGTICTILGANGAGKTTLLRAVAGQLQISAGAIAFLGSSVGRSNASQRVARGMALVPQGHQVFGGLSVFENLKMGAYARRRDGDLETSFEAVYELFPVLRTRHSQAASSLSGGERAMLAVGRGLMSKPRLLLLDEPSLGLAPKVRQSMFQTLADISRSTKMTILMAEQDISLALAIADYAYVLQGGRIVHHGKADDALVRNADFRNAYLGV
jgi:branched-chain amino acid transport system ATP-binding protein